jgi:hypothetical protein
MLSTEIGRFGLGNCQYDQGRDREGGDMKGVW